MRFADLKRSLDGRLARRELNCYVVSIPVLGRDDMPLAKLAYDSTGPSLIDDSLSDERDIAVDFLLPALMECDVKPIWGDAYDGFPGVAGVRLEPVSIFDLAEHASPERLPLWLTDLFRMARGESA
jgi:hypothetical protein